MAQTRRGNKIVFVHGYSYTTKSGKKVVVPNHYRSTEN